MLTSEIKKKIDSARDVLVGKVPDPKAQVEQITTALIYKFMDDMDKQAASLPKGKPQFFTNGFEKYSWSKLLDPKLGGQERLNLYGEAITKMSKNPHLPQLFRDVFKDAFLPYRDPETLNLFLKDINTFEYDHSENLGDAFEYLLSVLGSQGEAGQFRTPRHIIDFIVEVVDPKKDETILDPACGTAGFLISAYKHILKSNKNKPLNPDEKKRLMANLAGYDISPDMVKLSLVNMYLHGFPSPRIHEYDTLTSEEKWDERFDVMMANPPFMTPKGGIRPHKRFMVQANRSEVLFVDYIMEHLNNKGRAGIIVPEGIIFQSAGAYKQLRKSLVEDGLYAVVSLPGGVFNPYSGVKTSILFFDNQLAKQTKELLLIKVLNDGFDLGAQRRPVDRNDLPHAVEVLQAQREAVKTGKKNPLLKEGSLFAWAIQKTKVLENNDCSLMGELYRKVRDNKNIKWEMIELGEVLDYEQPTKYIVRSTNYDDSYKTPVLTAGKTFILGYTNETEGIFSEDLPVIIFDDFTTDIKFVDFPFKVKSSAMKILHAKKDKADIRFLFRVMKQIKFPKNEHKRYWISQFSKIKVPLPPLEVQKEIVDELDSYQKVIDGAKQIIEHHNPSIKIATDWEIVDLKDVAEVNKESVDPVKLFGKEKFCYIDISSVENGSGKVSFENLILPSEAPSRARRVIHKGDVLLSTVRPNLKAFAYITDIPKRTLASTGFAVLTPTPKINGRFLFALLFGDYLMSQMISKMGKGSYPSINQNDVEHLKIPLPPLDVQEKIAENLYEESSHIESTKRMIELYDEKIKSKIAEVWGE